MSERLASGLTAEELLEVLLKSDDLDLRTQAFIRLALRTGQVGRLHGHEGPRPGITPPDGPPQDL